MDLPIWPQWGQRVGWAMPPGAAEDLLSPRSATELIVRKTVNGIEGPSDGGIVYMLKEARYTNLRRALRTCGSIPLLTMAGAPPERSPWRPR